MKKYNRSDIFKKAWEIRKESNCSMSEALRNAWAIAKGEIKTETGAIIGESREITTLYRRAKGYASAYYKDEVLEAIDDGKGNITFQYPYGEFSTKNSRTSDVAYNLCAGAVNGDVFGLDWSKVMSVSGKTYSIKDDIKSAGLRWNSQDKNWVRI